MQRRRSILSALCALVLSAIVLALTPLSARAAEIIYSGTWGTCPWEIDADGVLTVHPGVGGESSTGSGYGRASYWDDYSFDITSVVFVEENGQKAIAPADSSCLFNNLFRVTSIDASGLDVSGVENMNAMFEQCGRLVSIDLTGWDTSNVTDMGYMFTNCWALTSLDLSMLDTSSVTNMSEMFFICNALEDLDVSGWDTSSVTNMPAMFSNCSKLTSLDLSSWDTSSVVEMDEMFEECTSLVSLNLSGWDTSSVNTTENMFRNCTSLTSLNISGWRFGSAANMEYMFVNCSSLTSLDLSGWDTSSVTKMPGLFYGCSSLASLNIAGWDTSSVREIAVLFYGCSSLSSLDLSGWNTSRVTQMQGMFQGCSSLDTIYVDEGWTADYVWEEFTWGVFEGCVSRVGGTGTAYDANHVDTEYARIDAPGVPGYLTSAASVTDLSSANISPIPDQGYTGSAITPPVTVTLDGTTLREGVDYTVTYSNNVNAGTATVTVTGRGSYKGAVSATFAIVAGKVTPPTAIGGLVYNGSEQAGVAEGAGYALSGTCAATDAGFYTAIAELADPENSTWTDGTTETKCIRWSIDRAEIEPPTAATGLVYNGSEQTGVAAGTGYTLSGAFAATAAGDYEAVATPDANHWWPGSVTAGFPVSWSIAKADIATATIASIPDQSYTGSAIEPAITVRLGGVVLKGGIDYTITYENNTEIGTATVTITGTGSCFGEKTATFKIVDKPAAPFFLDADPADDGNHGAEVDWMGRSGISAGWEVSGGREYRGLETVKRCDFAAFLYRMADLADDGTRNDSIALSPAEVSRVLSNVRDCTPSTDHAPEIAWLIKSGISRGWGNSDGTVSFRPYANVARQDMAAFLYRFADLDDDGVQNGSPEMGPQQVRFSDVRHGDEANHASEVEWLASVGVTKGWDMGNGTYQFRGTRNVARQDMAAFMYRLYTYLQSQG
ncbi:MAG: BspA family leucine-rich repeat surface protein [Atopobiaceae bacterium]|nr:BspA family leucine-rich repeat surface protein [Atopobiaceae bacterium]